MSKKQHSCGKVASNFLLFKIKKYHSSLSVPWPLFMKICEGILKLGKRYYSGVCRRKNRTVSPIGVKYIHMYVSLIPHCEVSQFERG